MKQKIRAGFRPDIIAVAFFAAFAASSALTLLPHVLRGEDLTAAAFLSSGSLPLTALFLAGFFCAYLLLGAVFSVLLPACGLLSGTFLYASVLLIGVYSAWTYVVMAALFTLSFFVFCHYVHPVTSELTKRRLGLLVAVLAAIGYATAIGLIALYRVFSYTSTCFDFAIFCQMFHSMAQDLTQSVTCERNQALQHFAVHISPVYYLLLPVYWLFPYPETLELAQVFVTLLAAVPLYLLAKQRGLRGAVPGILAACLLLFVPFVGGSIYDLHENCFLTLFLLFLFYFCEKGSIAGTAVFAVLVCSVKEDAPVYVAFYALYVLLSSVRLQKGGARRRRLLLGTGMLFLAVLWFAAACAILSSYGLGVMTDRFSNLTGGENSLAAVVKTALTNPGVLFRAIFNDASKIDYMICLFVPLCFVPFLSKKYERLVLVLPAILYHFLSDYTYQHQIYYQYAFGTTAFLFFAVILNLADFPREKQSRTALLSLGLSLLLFFGTITPKFSYIRKYENGKEAFADVSECLSQIPEDASVCASTCLCVRLSNRAELYNIDRSGYPTDTDYVILDLRYTNGKTFYPQYSVSPRWEEVASVPQYLAVFRAK